MPVATCVFIFGRLTRTSASRTSREKVSDSANADSTGTVTPEAPKLAKRPPAASRMPETRAASSFDP